MKIFPLSLIQKQVIIQPIAIPHKSARIFDEDFMKTAARAAKHGAGRTVGPPKGRVSQNRNGSCEKMLDKPGRCVYNCIKTIIQ